MHQGAESDANFDDDGDYTGEDGIFREVEIREQDRYLPVANIARIMKKVLPNNGKIAKDAKEAIQECVSEFISFITSEASDKCQQEKRKTINGDDILWAMGTLGFEKYLEPLKLYLLKYREAVKGDKPDKKSAARAKDSVFASVPSKPVQYPPLSSPSVASAKDVMFPHSSIGTHNSLPLSSHMSSLTHLPPTSLPHSLPHSIPLNPSYQSSYLLTGSLDPNPNQVSQAPPVLQPPSQPLSVGVAFDNSQLNLSSPSPQPLTTVLNTGLMDNGKNVRETNHDDEPPPQRQKL
jgi:nuclear transcription Y subunit beta